MKITELISALQVILVAESDLEVGVEDSEFRFFAPLQIVECRNLNEDNDDDPALGARFVGLQ